MVCLVCQKKTSLVILAAWCGVLFLLSILNTYGILQQIEVTKEVSGDPGASRFQIGNNSTSAMATSERETEPNKTTEHVNNLLIEESMTAEQRMIDRASRIRHTCLEPRLKDMFRWYQPSHKFLKSREDNSVFYCPIPKAAWSTWKYLFYKNASIEHLMGDMTHTGWRSEWNKAGLTVVDTTREVMKFTHRLVVIRDPYARLVSSYKDKVLSNDGYYVKKSRRPCSDIDPFSSEYPALTFYRFVECIVNRASEKRQRLDAFGAGRTLDIHWRPQTLLCDFCRSQYNILVRLEYFDQEVPRALQLLNMSKVQPVHENQSDNSTTTTHKLDQYYSQLTPELMEKVHNLYAYDRLLLGYDKYWPTTYHSII